MNIAAAAWLAIAATLSACTIGGAVQSQPTSTLPSAPPEPASVTAQVTQQRRDQIKRVVSLRITVGGAFVTGGDPMTVTDVRLDAPGFVRQRDVPWDHRPVLTQPHVAVALPVALAEADCASPPPGRPTGAIVTVSDGRGGQRTFELTDLADAGLLERIRAHDCAVASLQQRATFTLGSDWRLGRQGGRRIWRGSVDIARRPPLGQPIEVIGALGSVLVDFTPATPLPYPVPDRARSRLPIVASSSGRCDGHSMGESSKPFVFTLWVRADGVDVPLVLAVPAADLSAWWQRLAEACDEIRQGE
jgi:hypothetical protein